MLIACCIFVAAVLGALLFVSTHATPEGMFDEPRVAVDGYCYYEFRDGKVTLMTEFGSDPMGSYEMKDGIWHWTTGFGKQFRFSASLFELRVEGADGSERKIRRLFLRPRPKVKIGAPKKQVFSP